MEIDLGTGFLWFVVFLFSTTVHEAMHALVAWKGGDPTAYHGGQVSLSPIPHIRREPIGMLAVPLLTSLTQGWAMGWASAPYDPVWAERHPQRAALMAARARAADDARRRGPVPLCRGHRLYALDLERERIASSSPRPTGCAAASWASTTSRSTAPARRAACWPAGSPPRAELRSPSPSLRCPRLPSRPSPSRCSEGGSRSRAAWRHGQVP